VSWGWKATPRLRRFVACRASALALGLSSQMSPDGRRVIVVRRTDSPPWRITLAWSVTARPLAVTPANWVAASANSRTTMLALSGNRSRSPSVASGPVWKLDSRFHPARQHEAWEAEALDQSTIVRLVRNVLDGLLPEPLDDVLEREAEQRVRVAELLDGLDE